MKAIQISGKSIGIGQPVFIIAEGGINHNGKIELAKKLVDIAVDAGADAVKFQTFKSEDVVTKNAKMAKYQEKNLGTSGSQFDMIKKFELPYEKFIDIKNYCDKKGIIFLSTPHSDDAVDFLDPLIPAYKVGSGDLTNLPFLEKIAKKGKPVIISTGMSVLDEVIEAVNTVKKAGNSQIILLHCTTSYPCKISDANLRAMETMKKTFEDVLIGYSDHTLGVDVMKLAAKHGAVVIEKHFTTDKNLPGPDHKASLSTNELKEAVRAIKNKDYSRVSIDEEIVLGSSEKKLTPEEEEIAKIVRKSIVAKVKIPKGKIITKEMLVIKRPGTGIKPKYLNEIIGKRARVKLGQDEMISREDLN